MNVPPRICGPTQHKVKPTSDEVCCAFLSRPRFLFYFFILNSRIRKNQTRSLIPGIPPLVNLISQEYHPSYKAQVLQWSQQFYEAQLPQSHSITTMRSYFLIFTLPILLFEIGSATTTNNSPQCRCLPSDSCWPKANEWNAFNTSLSGKLLAVRPVASVCHDPAFNEAACQKVNASFSFSLWRSNQPGTLQVDRKSKKTPL